MESPENHAHHHHGTGVRWVDMVLAGSAILISLISLVVAVGHGRVMEKLVEENHRSVEASTWPFLQLDLTLSSTHGDKPDSAITVAATVSNHGNGPARIKTLQVLVDGKPIATTEKVLGACCKEKGDANYTSQVFNLNGTVLAQRESQVAFSLAPRNDVARRINHELAAALPRIEMRACYCSVFDECWIGSTNSPPREVKSCPTNIVNFSG